jgi:putative transposase
VSGVVKPRIRRRSSPNSWPQPNQCWSWDITKLLGPAKWTYYYLYVIIDIYSRYVVGWLLAEAESAALAEKLLADSITKHDINRDTLTVHADNGSSMASKPVAFLLADLGVTKSHSRPHTSNDNPYSEAPFKTVKYRPDFPECFGSLADARAFCQRFFTWYNTGSTTTPVSDTTTRSTSTTDGPRPSRRLVPTCSPPPTPATRNGSSANTPNHPHYPPPPGSTNPDERTLSRSRQTTQ